MFDNTNWAVLENELNQFGSAVALRSQERWQLPTEAVWKRENRERRSQHLAGQPSRMTALNC